jgi:hypothetical protein
MGSVQTSTLYEQTAEKIANDSGKKLPQPKIKTSVSEDKVLIRDGKIEIKLKDKKSGENSAIIDPKNNHFINLNQTKGEIELDSIEFKKELMDYYKGENKYKSPNMKIDKSALEVLNLYKAFPNSSFKPKDAIQVFTVTKQKTH